METDTIKNLLCTIVGVLGILFCTFLIGYGCGQNQSTINEVERVDTLFIFDTITQYKAILEERVVLQEVLVPIKDTIWKHDTMFVCLEREQVMWQDSLSRIYASGILPQIDSVQHFITERVVTREMTRVVPKPCKWGLGIHAGYGVQIGDQIRTAPYIGIGISYDLLTW